MVIRLLIVAVALAGLADALYFTLAYYGRVRKARWVPEVLCAREGSSCVTVVQTPYARVFAVPNSLLGMVFYLAVIVRAFSGRPASRVGDSLLVAACLAAVALGFYLVYALRRKLHTHCPLCYAAHGINLSLLVLLISMVTTSR